MRVSGNDISAIDCDSKHDWICEGTTENRLNEAEGIIVQNDLKMDEGGFCLWHYREPLEHLPNDEGTNFKNTDLACSLQVSSYRQHACYYDPSVGRRRDNGQVKNRRGSRHMAANYPVTNARVGLTGPMENQTFLSLDDAYDIYHCHYSTSNSGLLRVWAMQHMYERNYAGSMVRTCRCGVKHMSNIVSRCDCTRSHRQNNNCATWHRKQLLDATVAEPVSCNNCNNNDNF